MEIKQINQLMSAMVRNDIKKLALKKEGFEIELERADGSIHPSLEHTISNPMSVDFEKRRAHHNKADDAEQTVEKEEAAKEDDDEGISITSPMVGTFYRAAAPTDAPFIKVGDTVEESTVVCLIEAMKVMNEVKADVKGVVTEVLIDNAHPVEFGTPLFRISTP